MRTIKFRAWDTKNNDWYIDPTPPFWWHIEDGKTVTITTEDLPEHVVLMQFTGLLDKNGKEIYEGDIVKLYEWKDNPDIYRVHPNLFKIEYMDDCGRASFELYSTDELWGNLPNGEERKTNEGIIIFSDFKEEDIYDIVGNIYQNPELLK